MARIMCTNRLLRALDLGRPPRVRKELLFPNTRLGSWAVGMTAPDDGEFVIAMNVTTCLTLVFASVPGRLFRHSFAKALGTGLAGFGIPPDRALIETAVVESAPVTGLRDAELAGTLRDLAFFCGIELEYHDDLQRVQINLNEFPHFPRHPREALAEVFGLERMHPRHH